MESKFFRTQARERLAGHWGISIGIAALAALLGGLIVGGSFLPEIEYETENLELFAQLTGTLGISFSVLGLAQFILGGVLQLGYAKFLLKQFDEQECAFNVLFSEFDRFGVGFAQAFLRGLYTVLWSLLFIIPGIIAGYRYAMTPFILAEYPDLSASEAIERSKAMMDGHKGELFFLDLSFIGWALLAALSMNVGNLLLNPYRNAAYAAFYRDLCVQVKNDRTEEFL